VTANGLFGATASVLFLLVILVGVIAAVTKPNESALKNALLEKYGLVYGVGALAEKIGLVEMKYHDYLIFSTLSIQLGIEPERTVAFGLFGKTVVPDAFSSLSRVEPPRSRSTSDSTNDTAPLLQPPASSAPPTQNTIQVFQNCFVSNATGGMVKLRRDCDTKNCEQDPSTMYTEVEDGTQLGLLNLNNYSSGRFTWRPVSYNGEVVWISAAKLFCPS
jgi:hypothetical protein